MPPSSKKLEGHMLFGRLSVHSLYFSCEQDILIIILARALKFSELTVAGE